MYIWVKTALPFHLIVQLTPHFMNLQKKFPLSTCTLRPVLHKYDMIKLEVSIYHTYI